MFENIFSGKIFHRVLKHGSLGVAITTVLLVATSITMLPTLIITSALPLIIK